MADDSTTPDLVDLTRRCYEALSSGDIDGFMSFAAPEAVFEAVALGASFEGVVAIRGFVEEWTGAYDGYHAEVEEILDLGGGVVFAVVRQSGHPHASAGRVTGGSIGNVHSWVDGLVVRVTSYLDLDEARAAAERLADERGRRCRRTWTLCAV